MDTSELFLRTHLKSGLKIYDFLHRKLEVGWQPDSLPYHTFLASHLPRESVYKKIPIAILESRESYEESSHHKLPICQSCKIEFSLKSFRNAFMKSFRNAFKKSYIKFNLYDFVNICYELFDWHILPL